MMKPKKSVKKKTKIKELEVDVLDAEKVTCKACELSHPVALCPFCSKEGLVLIAVAIILVAINNMWTRYAAWAFLLAAFLVPTIKDLFRKKA